MQVSSWFSSLRAALTIAAFSLLAAPATAQRTAPAPAEPEPSFTVRLTPKSVAYQAGATAEFNVFVQVNRDVDVPASLLSGALLRASVDGVAVPGVAVHDDVEGVVRMTAGTVFQRPVKLPLKGVTSGDGATQVVVEWFGLPDDAAKEATTGITIVPDQSSLDLSKLDLAKVKLRLVTSEGDLVLGFLPNKAPKHVENMLKLAKDGFYNQTRFHRVVRGFMIQGGCPNTRPDATGIPGTGDPGYLIDAEFNDTPHERGVLSMARSQSPNSAGCQFFICHQSARHLDNKYTAFGRLLEGFETLDTIANARVLGDGSTPAEPVWIYAAILEGGGVGGS